MLDVGIIATRAGGGKMVTAFVMTKRMTSMPKSVQEATKVVYGGVVP